MVQMSDPQSERDFLNRLELDKQFLGKMFVCETEQQLSCERTWVCCFSNSYEHRLWLTRD
jgi:hypothetical protein